MDNGSQHAPQLVIFQGPLKKRGSAVGGMHDRYCVATWEATDTTTHKAVVVRTYKTHAAYNAHPLKALDTHTLKCVSAWDGKGRFHTYPFGFVMETRDSKLLLCAAPTQADQTKWLELMSMADSTTAEGGSTITTNGQHIGDRTSHTKSSLFASDDEDEDDHDYEEDEEDKNYGQAAAMAIRDKHTQRFEQERLPHAQNDLLSSEDEEDDGAEGFDSDDENRRSPVSPLALSPMNDTLLFRADSETESLTLSQDRHHANEPDDWGIYGDVDGDGPSRYDVVDGPVLSLDTELLKTTAPLASDDFLFEQNGPTFGAVVVPASRSGGGPEDFVDPVREERRDRKKKEKQFQRVTKKLESNRDLYAEMAAARLTSMRKDAQTKPRPSVSHRRRGEEDEDDEEDEEDDDDDWSDGETIDQERSRAVSAAGTSKTSVSKTSTPRTSSHDAVRTPFELEEIESDDEPLIKRQSLEETSQKTKKKKNKAKARGESLESDAWGGEDLLFGDASMPVEVAHQQDEAAEAEEVAATVAIEEEEEIDDEEARRLRREKRRLRRQQQAEAEAEAAAAQAQEVERARQASVTVTEEPVRRSSMDDQWQRATESQKRKDERRRARKEKNRREAEAAAAAEDLARQHREELRRQEEDELKQARRERKERKKSKEKKELERKAKELKKKETALLAEAEKLKQTQEALLRADEIKDVARKTKRRDKYTRPADRIQRREKELELEASQASARASAEDDMSTALVVVEPSPPASATATVSPSTETASSDLPDAAAVAEASPPPVSAPAAVSVASPTVAAPPQSVPAAYSATPPPSSETVLPPAPQSAPHHGLPQPVHYPPGYPAPPSMPYPMSMSMPMPYGAPYSAVHYTPGFPAVPYGPGVAMPTPYYPHLGYVGGIAPMSAPAQMQAYAMMQPPSSSAASMTSVPPYPPAEEERFIGPLLPSLKSVATTDHVLPAPTVIKPSSKASSSTASLPDLPDVADF